MGTVDVERYTGSCLISTAVRSKVKNNNPDKLNRAMRLHEDVQVPSNPHDPRNLAGAPLVSIAASIRRGGNGPKHKNNHRPHAKDQQHPGVWRPALILPPSVYLCNGNDTQNYGQRNPHSLQGAPLIRLPRVAKAPTPKQFQLPNVQTVPLRGKDAESFDGSSSCISSDCSSVTSDEGVASSAGSDSSLPRLIKPRKRRKKERKVAFGHQLTGNTRTGDDTFLPENESEFLANETIARLLQLNLDSPSEAGTPPPPLLGFHRDPYPDLRTEDPFQESTDTMARLELNLPESSQMSGFHRDPYGLAVEESGTHPWGFPSRKEGAWNSVWGSPEGSSLSPWSNEVIPSRDNYCSSWWPESLAEKWVPEVGTQALGLAEAPRGGSLEVSSEIITSPYGHRDIEIRFFSSTLRSAASTGEEKN